MKREKWFAAAGAVLALVLLVELGLTLREVKDLREQVDNLRNDLMETSYDLQNEISDISGGVRRELEAQASLFSSAETSLDYRDGALVLTASVLPKEVRTGETLTLSAGGVTSPMEAGADGTYTATLSLPPAAELTPAVAFTSPEGVRQEALDSLWTGDVLSVEGESDFVTREDGSTAVYVGLNPNSNGPVADRADVASLKLQVVDAPTGIQLGEIEMEPISPPDLGTSTGSSASAVNLDAMWYAADVTTYAIQGEDYDLEFWAVLTISGGLALTDLNPAATLYASGASGGGSSGSLSLSPAWEE